VNAVEQARQARLPCNPVIRRDAPVPEETHATVHQRAEFVAADYLGRVTYERRPSHLVIDDEVNLRVPGCRHDPSAIFQTRCQGFLAQHVFSGLDCRERHLHLLLGRDGYVDEVELRVANQLAIRVRGTSLGAPLQYGLAPAGIRIEYAPDSHAEPRVDRQVSVLHDLAAADDPNGEFRVASAAHEVATCMRRSPDSVGSIEAEPGP